MKTFFEKLNEGYYDGRHVAQLMKPASPRLTTTKPNAQQLLEYEAKYEKYQTDFAEWKMLRETEIKEMEVRNAQFKYDLFTAHIEHEDIEEYKDIIDVIYQWAYAYGHANSYTCIAEHFADMLDILWGVKAYALRRLQALREA